MKNTKKQREKDNKRITKKQTKKVFSFLLVCFLLSSASAVHASEMNTSTEASLGKTIENEGTTGINGKSSETASEASPIEVNYSWGKDAIDADDYVKHLLDEGIDTEENAVKIAVIDSGIDTEDTGDFFTDKIVDGYNFFDDNDMPSDVLSGKDNEGNPYYHGTYVAGTILNCTKGIKNIKIMPLRVFGDIKQDPNSEESAYSAISADFLKAVDYAIEKEADIICIPAQIPYDETVNQKITEALNHNIVVISSSGDESKNISEVSPASTPDIITVSGCDKDGNPMHDCNKGESITFYAPGKNIPSIQPYGIYVNADGSGSASAHVTALAAMAIMEKKSKKETVLPSEIKENLLAMCPEGELKIPRYKNGDHLSPEATEEKVFDNQKYHYVLRGDTVEIQEGISKNEEKLNISLHSFDFTDNVMDAEEESTEHDSDTMTASVKTIRIGDNAFSDYEWLNNLTLSGSVESVGAYAFKNCKQLKTVTLSEGLKTIKNEAFINCSALKEITVPGSVSKIEKYAIGYLKTVKNNNDGDPEEISYVPVPGFIIRGYKDSEAESYAKANGITFVLNDVVPVHFSSFLEEKLSETESIHKED